MNRSRGVTYAKRVASQSEVTMSDEALMHYLAEGHHDAMAVLMWRYYDRVYSYVWWILRNAQDAEDVMQTAFTRVFTHCLNFRSAHGSFSNWLYMIARRLAFNVIRDRKRRPDWSLDELLNDLGDHWATLEAPGTNVDGCLLGRQRREIIHQVIRTLPENYRAPIVLRDLEGLPYGEIARLLGIPDGSVRSRINRGRRMLARKLYRYRYALTE